MCTINRLRGIDITKGISWISGSISTISILFMSSKGFNPYITITDDVGYLDLLNLLYYINHTYRKNYENLWKYFLNTLYNGSPFYRILSINWIAGTCTVGRAWTTGRTACWSVTWTTRWAGTGSGPWRATIPGNHSLCLIQVNSMLLYGCDNRNDRKVPFSYFFPY